MKDDVFRLTQYNYKVPAPLIAQSPAPCRDESRLLVVNRKQGTLRHGVFRDVLEFLRPGDVLVLNDTKVIKARLFAHNGAGGKVEVLLVKKRELGLWEVLVKPGRRAKLGAVFVFGEQEITAKILDKTPAGGRLIEFSPPEVESYLDYLGAPPLPPYIKKKIDDVSRYQTVYAKKDGAIAAPTAGLHFTPKLINQIVKKGVEVVYVTLHCGLATFRPVKTGDIRCHPMPAEWIEVNNGAAGTVNKAKQQGRRVIAVGTTSIRALESAAGAAGSAAGLISFSGETNLYIVPGYKFKVVDGVITNFHTPCSTNIILISSFCGQDLLKKAYDYAVEEKFRFYSFGDAALII